MSEQYDEHEQSERVKQWLVKNGSNLLTGLLLAVSAVFGWQWWQNHQAGKAQEAGTQYRLFVDAVEKPDIAKALALSEALANKHGQTDYAFLAQLRLAKLQQMQGKSKDALAALDKAASVAANERNRELAMVRKLQMLVSQGELAEAGKLAATIKPDYFPATLAEARGDLALAADKRKDAVGHYRQALLHTEPGTGSRSLIELKLTEAGGAADTAQEIR